MRRHKKMKRPKVQGTRYKQGSRYKAQVLDSWALCLACTLYLVSCTLGCFYPSLVGFRGSYKSVHCMNASVCCKYAARSDIPVFIQYNRIIGCIGWRRV